MKVVVTGASGFLGTTVCRRLLRDGHEVLAVDRMPQEDLELRVRIADLENREACYPALEGGEALVHLANHAHPYGKDPQTLFNGNAAINMNVFQAACDLGINQWIFASSIQVVSDDACFGEEGAICSLPYLPMDENLPPQPGNPYSLSKLVAERIMDYFCSTRGVQAVALRFPWLTHPEQVRRARGRDHYHYSRINDVFSYVLVEDAADAIVRFIGESWTGFRVFMPAAHDTVIGRTMAELVPIHYKDVQLRVPPEEMPGPVDTASLQRETGWTPTPVAD